MDRNSKHVATRVSDSVLEQLIELSKKLDRPTAWVIRRAIEEYISKHYKAEGKQNG